MERLTKYNTGKGHYVSAIGSGQGCWTRIINQLAAYEETGLTPEQVAAMKAELQDERYRHDRYADYSRGQDEVIDRLKAELRAYQDTGLTPEICAAYKKFEDEAISKGVTFNRIVELMEAEKDGRLVVLPCRAGDTVYDTRQDIDSRRKNVVVPLSVSGFDVTLCVWETWYGPFPKLKDFGKTVFLTHEEAEAALRGGEGK